jgi:hypothetical protein
MRFDELESHHLCINVDGRSLHFLTSIFRGVSGDLQA